ncbi:protein mom-5-like [Amphiura filiformis]|uniref:protein mom-5-like n=1 Tax=Amphiura filiformis TaxID=82378 RepID=UPI003B21D39D
MVITLAIRSTCKHLPCVLFLTCLLALNTSPSLAASTCNLSCDDITLLQCRFILPYSQAGFPNFLGHKDPSEASQFQTLITELTLEGCYEYTRNFLCGILFSECEEGVGFLLPSKTMCVDFISGCKDNSYFESSSLKIDCNKFPDPESTEPIHVCHESVLSISSSEMQKTADVTYKTVPIILCTITALIAIFGTAAYYLPKVRHNFSYSVVKQHLKTRRVHRDTSEMDVYGPDSETDPAEYIDDAAIRTTLGYSCQTYV